MRQTNSLIIFITAISIAVFGLNNAIAARGGHGGGVSSHGGGGWSGGGRNFEHADYVRPNNHPDRNHDWRDHDHTFNKNVTVNTNGDGWYNYGAADEALAGMMMVTAMGTVAAKSSDTDTIIIEQPASPAPQQQQPVIPSIGDQVSMLPQGCQARNVNGVLLYQSGTAWYRPYFGSGGVYYQVVQPPASDDGSGHTS